MRLPAPFLFFFIVDTALPTGRRFPDWNGGFSVRDHGHAQALHTRKKTSTQEMWVREDLAAIYEMQYLINAWLMHG